jgi:hypothetical protein
MTHLLLAILSGTPLWVWGTLALIVAIGLRQARTRDIPAQRVVAVPVLLAGYSLWGASAAFAQAGSALLLGAWLAGAAAGWSANRVLDLPRRVQANADGSFRIEGSYAPLVLMLCVFLARYANGITLAMKPELAREAWYVCAATLVFAAPAGLFAARSRKVWRSRRGAGGLAAA